MTKIYAPNKSADGIFASVRFVDGVGETDNVNLIKWFSNHGYSIGREPFDDGTPAAYAEEIHYISPANYEFMEVDELKAYAKSIGMGRGVGVLKTKEQVIAHINKKERE